MIETDALRAELADAREMLELGGLSYAEERAITQRVGELELQLKDQPAPAAQMVDEQPPEVDEPPLQLECAPLLVERPELWPDKRPELWRRLAALNTRCEDEALDGEERRAAAYDRDRIWRKLERAA